MSALNVRAWSGALRLLVLLPLLGVLACLPACADAKKSMHRNDTFHAKYETAKATSMAAKMAATNANTEFSTETYNHFVDNPFLLAAKFPLSTFSADVNTASYSNVRRFLLQEKRLPPKDAVRIAEFINYFEYDYPDPQGEHPIALATEIADCPWDHRLKLVRIGLQAKKVSLDNLPPRNLVFLLDTSGSMDAPNRLPLLKQSLQLLTAQLRPQDRVAIVAYAGSAGLVLPSTPGTQREKIVAALDQLHAGGSTNGGAGIELAYQVAQQNFIANGVNRVIIGTDGDFNVGVTSPSDLIRLIEEKRRTGVYLSILGFGMGNLKDATMEKLAHHGNGHYAYIDTLEEAKKQFVDRGGALYTVANDVKIQVEFNPARVHAYRLIGYENRLLKDQDFNDDRTDAGDMGAGHCVTAFYVIAPPGIEINIPHVDALKYQQPAKLSDAALTKELLTVKVRYTPPGTTKSRLLTQSVLESGGPFVQARAEFRFAAAVAGFGMLLRDSPYQGTLTYAGVIQIATAALGQDTSGHRAEFIQMVQVASQLATTKK